MNFVVFAGNSACRSLLDAIDASEDDRVVAAACNPTLRAEVEGLAETTCALRDWQQLLVAPGAEAGIVCGHDEDAREAAWQIAVMGLHLIVYPDARQTASFAYRLWPLAVDGSSVLMPVSVYRLDPQWRELRERLQQGRLGRLRDIEFSRREPADASGIVDDEAVSRHLLHDADLLRWLCGEFSRVTSLQTGRAAGGVASQSVTLAGDGCPEATWSMKAAAGEPHWRLTISAQTQTEIHSSDRHPQSEDDVATTVHLAEACQGIEILREFERLHAEGAGGREWIELVRDFDVLDATRRSIRRRRTVEIGSDEFSEQGQFKSKMSAAGCGALLYTMVALVFVLLAGALLDPRDAAQKRSQTADFVLGAEDFQSDTTALTQAGKLHLEDIRARLWQTTAEIIIDPEGASAEVTDGRRATVLEEISNPADPIDASRVVVRELEGRWFQRGMLIAWVLVFLPGGVILLLQGLLLVARPAAGDQPHSAATDRTTGH